MSAAIEFKDVDILFPRERGSKGVRSLAAALAKLDAGGTRDEISAECGVILGVAGASLAIAPGEICVMMGLSGSGKSTLLRAANGLNAVTRGQVLAFGQGPQVRRVQTWLYGVSTPAAAQAFGSSCGTANVLGRLGSDEPTLGNRGFRLEILGGPASAPAAIGLAGAPQVQRVFWLCDLYLAPPFLPLATATNAFGMAAVTMLAEEM